MSNKENIQKQDLEILKRICRENGVSVELITELIEIEEKSQLQSRWGIYDNLADTIKEFSKEKR